MSDRETRPTARSKLVPALFCLSLLCAAIPCAGAARLEASLGFGGYTAPGRWAPLWIRCEGLPPSASIRVLRLSAEGGSLGAETFPILEGVRLECPVWMNGELESISIRLLSGDRALAELKLEARAKPFPGHIVLACGLSKEARLALASSLMPIEPVLVIPMTSADLPSNGLDYDAASAIAIADQNLELSPAQRGAIFAWMAGGGRLCVAEVSGGQSSVPYGLGRLVSLPQNHAETPASWESALALAPYDPSLRKGAGSIGRGPEAEGGAIGASSGFRALIAAAIAAWLFAIFLATILFRSRIAPLTAVSGLCLAAVFAGGPALDRALIRGAGVRALSLVLPESGAAFLSLRAKAYVSPSSLDWATARAIGTPSFAYSGTETGNFHEWRHTLTKAAFGIRTAGDGGIDLEAMLGPDEWRGIAAGSTTAFSSSRASPLRGGTEPPEVESSYPLAFLASGEPVAWWVKDPGAHWMKLKASPDWLEGDAPWLLALRGGKSSLSILAGSCPADSLALRVEGGPLGEVRWAMPLPKGGGQ
jgi:hypothetical protein